MPLAPAVGKWIATDVPLALAVTTRSLALHCECQWQPASEPEPEAVTDAWRATAALTTHCHWLWYWQFCYIGIYCRMSLAAAGLAAFSSYIFWKQFLDDLVRARLLRE